MSGKCGAFSAELSHNQEDLLGIGEAFLQRAVDFETLYVEFCIKHSKSIQALEKESQLQTELWSDILTCQTALGHILPLATYLLKPVQRVLKYQLLLQVIQLHFYLLASFFISREEGSCSIARAIFSKSCKSTSSIGNKTSTIYRE
ncbi:unnamed protein product [Dibothriocephalus latus]|uniref:DH domain-containing protein n=1 Tax=Dibothriocephalus latus TaxID=60516 RepID=A0A3P6PZD1_DIBLA|nr:unnamed protein product [Dibothriocephalus latus]